MSDSRWAPSAARAALVARATLFAKVRAFFAARDVLEVDTPLLCRSTATDPYLASLSLSWRGEQFFLQTSPEFAMKRLLAAGCGALYQISHAFRADESGRLHNPEFTLLEWYRPGFTLDALMDETEALVRALATEFRPGEALDVTRLSYREAFLHAVGLDPMTASTAAIAETARERLGHLPDDWDRDGWLNVLMAGVVEPGLGPGLTFIHGFPASQAALAQTVSDDTGMAVAARVELYAGGVELANGYQELTDAMEQSRRFSADRVRRAELGLEDVPMPDALIAALTAGMPACAGIAVGLDRLLMWLMRADQISDILPFDLSRV